MLKLNRTATQSRERPTSGGNFFDAADNPDTVTVSNGPYGDNYPVAGMTVAQIRARLRDRLDIDPQSQAIVDGHDVGEDTVVQHGQALMFAHRASEKGVPIPCPSEDDITLDFSVGRHAFAAQPRKYVPSLLACSRR